LISSTGTIASCLNVQSERSTIPIFPEYVIGVVPLVHNELAPKREGHDPLASGSRGLHPLFRIAVSRRAKREAVDTM